MAPREIIAIPDKRLRLKSEPVGKIDDSIRKLVEEMFEAMYAAPGIGLAAIQLGDAKRVITMDLAKKDPKSRRFSSIRKSCGPPTTRTCTRKAASRSRNIMRRSSGRPR